MTKWGRKEPLGVCDISGLRYPLRRMKKTWDGLLVHPRYFDPKHPQIDGPPSNLADEEALTDARPYNQGTAYNELEFKKPDNAKEPWIIVDSLHPNRFPFNEYNVLQGKIAGNIDP